MANKRRPFVEEAEVVAAASQRIDKWLVFARIVKTRGIAQQLVETRKVRLNKDKIDNPARNIRLGDVLTISYSSRVHVLKVTGFAERRGSPAEAQALYEDLSVPAAAVAASAADEPSAEPVVAVMEGVFDDIGRGRRDPVQRDKDRRTARKAKSMRETW
ncbi:S4 domain-containing protein [Fulvimarina sp. 2208YS6-2-32]|uniref:S4 domain-containing protein n=1 Tax=Fulvimarina uroteuthidis TaxID=3098149 RepID=A0ABU5HYC9_9HYPH|nr:S4 domain-containing protein [Fulvimarina sp. 2208YS6-2-32]MDY8107589.1 S4 domain-containing protein [Fulvimarina sp. 2208YS6-2-32]